MADEEKKIEDGQEPAADQVELVGEAKKAEAEAIEALPKVEKAETPKPEKVAEKPSKKPANYTPRLKAGRADRQGRTGRGHCGRDRAARGARARA